MKRVRLSVITIGTLLALSVATSCNSKGQLGSETNWLGHCDSSRECGKGTCMCGVCTVACTAGAACGGAVCVEKGTAAYVASCGAGASVPPGVCAVSCSGDGDCGDGLRCVGGACVAPMGRMDAGPSATGASNPNAHDTGVPDAPTGKAVQEAGAVEAGRPCTPDDWTTSDEAVAAVRARSDFLTESYLVSVTGPTNQGPPDGRGEWDINFSEITGTRYDNFHVCGSIIRHRLGASSQTCSEGLTSIPSAVVFADALDRVTALTRYDRISPFLEQIAPCGGGQLVQHVVVSGDRLGDGGAVVGSDRWYADYTNGPVLEKLCGPCGAKQADCTPCVAGPSMPYSLIAATSTDQSTKADCLAFDGGIVTGSTSFDSGGQLTNTKCILAMVELAGGTWLISGPSYDVYLKTPDFDDDPVRHSTNTTEDRVRNGTFDMQIYPLDALGNETSLLWSGSLFIGSFDTRTRTAYFGGTPDTAR
jgi:hypothetical protein